MRAATQVAHRHPHAHEQRRRERSRAEYGLLHRYSSDVSEHHTRTLSGCVDQCKVVRGL
ncbi:MAG: hypothetical protein QOG63_2136, partial [Thermoleophilaceae bacterium]|nr:hypothetical protein [Thermoleophilaceae bacterium]